MEFSRGLRPGWLCAYCIIILCEPRLLGGQALLSFPDPRKVCPKARFQLPGQGSHLPALRKQASFQDARGNHSQLPASTSLSSGQGKHLS